MALCKCGRNISTKSDSQGSESQKLQERKRKLLVAALSSFLAGMVTTPLVWACNFVPLPAIHLTWIIAFNNLRNWFASFLGPIIL